jgi:alpha-beta hydrolase superfamily lysophospholipase
MFTTQSPPSDVVIPSLDGLPLKGWYWSRPNPRGVVVIAHGFGEHGGCYRHVAEALGRAIDIDVVSPDLRGHGRSPGRRGYVGSYEQLIGDLRAAVSWARRIGPGLPRFVLGHSNGGQLALRLALEPKCDVAGLIVSNPSLKVATHVPLAKLVVARILRRLAPGVTLSAKLAPDLLTRDPAMQREHETDPLRHSRMSAPLFFGMVEGGVLVAARAPEIRLPLLMILGSADPVIDPEFSRLVFEQFGSDDKTLLIFPKMLHEPVNELGRDQVLADIASWLDERLSDD